MADKKAKELTTVTETVYMVDESGKYVSHGKRHKIFRTKENEGLIISDGRLVRKDKTGRWRYKAVGE